jgi:hypothetical protein
MPPEIYLDCPTCGQVCEAVTPDCGDGHGADCPDRVCLECGTALFLDPLLVRGRRAGTPVPHAA